MIMPCMNSTSACERGGSVPFVDGGSVLLGLPGAPGCTTTGVAGSVCSARALQEKKPVEALAANSMPHRIFRRYRSIRFDCGGSVDPTLGYRYDVEPSRTE